MACQKSLILLLAALILLVGGVEAQKMVWVGGGNGNRWISPWGYGLQNWKAPKLLPNDVLVFQWVNELHSVHKVDAADYTACTFLNAKPLARGRYYGFYTVKVRVKDIGKTIYFSSNVGDDCNNGIKAAFTVAS